MSTGQWRRIGTLLAGLPADSRWAALAPQIKVDMTLDQLAARRRAVTYG